MANRTPMILYHYCSLETFQNIVENKSIWLSDVQKSNDSKELEWIKGQCRYYILKTWVDYIKSMDDEQRLNQVTVENYKEIEKLEKLIQDYNYTKTWAFCLSEKKDDLSQWRGYADDGLGISIGFKSDFFMNLQLVSHYIDENSNFYFKKVNYSKSQVEDFFCNYLDLKNIDSSDTAENVINKLNKCVYLSILNAPFFKNESFKAEKEWRLAYSMSYLELLRGNMPIVLPQKDDFEHNIESNYGYVVKNNELVSHIEIKFPSIKDFISSITLGPKSKITVIDMKEYLIYQGVLKDAFDKSIKIHSSSSTYR